MTTISQGNWCYAFTDEDALWAVRMLQGEGPPGDAPAVLWTMAQLLSPEGQRSKFGRPDRFDTFTKLIQAYSQPINPIWRRDGSKCRPGGSHHGRENCSEARLARRDYYATLPYTGVDAAKRDVLERWAAGQIANPVPGATDFAHRSVISDARRAQQPVLWTSPSGNQFLRSRVPLATPVVVKGTSGVLDKLDQLTPFGAALRRLTGGC